MHPPALHRSEAFPEDLPAVSQAPVSTSPAVLGLAAPWLLVAAAAAAALGLAAVLMG